MPRDMRTGQAFVPRKLNPVFPGYVSLPPGAQATWLALYNIFY